MSPESTHRVSTLSVVSSSSGCVTHVDNKILDRECRLGTLLDVNVVLVLVPVKDLGHVAIALAWLDANDVGVDAGFNHIGLDHAHRLLTDLVRRDIDSSVFRTTQHAGDKLGIEAARSTEATWIGVFELKLGRKDGLATRKEEAVLVALARDHTSLGWIL